MTYYLSVEEKIERMHHIEIKVDEAKVSPSEVEKALGRCKDIADVRMKLAEIQGVEIVEFNEDASCRAELEVL